MDLLIQLVYTATYVLLWKDGTLSLYTGREVIFLIFSDFLERVEGKLDPAEMQFMFEPDRKQFSLDTISLQIIDTVHQK